VATATTSGTAAVPATEMNGVAHFDNASGVIRSKDASTFVAVKLTFPQRCVRIAGSRA